MKFMLTWSIPQPDYQDAVDQFLAGKEKIPAGLKLVGRWHSAAHGWTLVETESVTDVYRFTDQWNALVDFDVTPVMDDKEAARIHRQA